MDLAVTERVEHAEVFVGQSQVMRELMASVDKIAEASDTTVLIEGETGTGKDWLAHLIHRKTPARAQRPFIALRCACLPDRELQTALFGEEDQGGGAGARPGALELGQRGTVFLDEVADMTLANQDKILELLSRKVYRRLGGKRDLWHDVRVIAATSRDLAVLRDAGAFRLGLHRRLSTLHIRVPALRERSEDIVPLARHFVAEVGARMGRPSLTLTPDTEQALLEYAFPGNLRELKLLVEAAAVRAEKDVIALDHIHFADHGDSTRRPFFWAALDDHGRPPPLRFVKERYMHRVLDFTKGNRAEAARVLEISLPTLVRKESH